MKTIGTIIFAIFLLCNLVTAQDTMYVYRAGTVISKQAVADMDSVIFYQAITTPPGNTVSDIDGNVYHTVTIGTQTWMVENLKTTKYRNGEPIGTTSPATLDISADLAPKYQWAYGGDENNVATYGRLYTWNAATDSRNVCPVGWHVPSDAEWTTLTTYLGGIYLAGNELKETGTSHWQGPGIGQGATNSSGFTALPGGHRNPTNSTFDYIGIYGMWWSTAESNYADHAWDRYIGYEYGDVLRGDPYKSYGLSVRCVLGTVPSITSIVVSEITSTTATGGGNIASDGGAAITARGVCWSTNQNPTIADSITFDGTGTGSFTSSLTGLTANTLYYVRAYATNGAGTAYGTEVSFTTEQNVLETVADNDGNAYHTVTIGTQTWMVENLKTTKYNDGTSIPNITDGTAWSALTTPGYCFYNNDVANKNIYGALYNWYTVNTGKLAPTGWHVPTDAEWTTLENYLIANGYNYDGTTTGNKIAKSLAATTLWNTYSTVGAIGNDLTKNNTSGFAGLPGGDRYSNGSFWNAGNDGYWWGSDEFSTYGAWSRHLGSNNSDVFRDYGTSEQYGFSVRCVRDF